MRFTSATDNSSARRAIGDAARSPAVAGAAGVRLATPCGDSRACMLAVAKTVAGADVNAAVTGVAPGGSAASDRGENIERALVGGWEMPRMRNVNEVVQTD